MEFLIAYKRVPAAPIYLVLCINTTVNANFDYASVCSAQGVIGWSRLSADVFNLGN